MEYRTQYDKRDRENFRTCPGRQEYEVYTADEDGNPIVSGMRNRYDEIQSHRESVELSVLLQRYALGDESALNKRIGQYVDVSDAPESFAQYLDGFKKMESDFFSLPEGFRELFGNSTVDYWRSIGSEDFAKKIDQYMASLKKSGNSVLDNSVNNNSGNIFSGEGSVLDEPKSE